MHCGSLVVQMQQKDRLGPGPGSMAEQRPSVVW
jgi:hypothetical protein